MLPGSIDFIQQFYIILLCKFFWATSVLMEIESYFKIQIWMQAQISEASKILIESNRNTQFFQILKTDRKQYQAPFRTSQTNSSWG